MNPLVLKGWDNPRNKANNSILLSPEEDVTEDPKIQEDIVAIEKSHCDLIYVFCMGLFTTMHDKYILCQIILIVLLNFCL